MESWLNRPEQDFCFALQVSGLTLQILRSRAPQSWERLKLLLDSGRVELIAQPYYHSFSFMKDRDWFEEEVRLQQNLIQQLQGKPARIFANPSLLYNNYLGYWAHREGYQSLIIPAEPLFQQGKTAYQRYEPPHAAGLQLLPHDVGLSRAFEAGDLNVQQFSDRVDQILLYHPFCLLGFDLRQLPARPAMLSQLKQALKPFLKDEEIHFQLPSELASQPVQGGEIDVPFFTSNRSSLQAWLGNPLQKEIWRALFQLQPARQHAPLRALHSLWANLLDSSYLLEMQGDFSQKDASQVPLDAYRQLRAILADFDLKCKRNSA
jgi:alpha-amylase